MVVAIAVALLAVALRAVHTISARPPSTPLTHRKVCV